MHILQVCPRVPFPLHTGGAIAMYDVAAGLVRAGHRVTMLAINTPKHRQPADALDHLGPNFRLVTVDVDTDISAPKALRNLLFSRQPYNVERFISPAVAARLLELRHAVAVDVVQLEGTFVPGTPSFWAGSSGPVFGCRRWCCAPTTWSTSSGRCWPGARRTRSSGFF